MAVPLTAVSFPQAMDPADQTDFEIVVSRAPATLEVSTPLLGEDEGIASFNLAVTAEAAAAGLTILTTGGRAPVLSGDTIKFWLGVTAELQSAPQFEGAGIDLAIEATIVTNASPARIMQRTAIVKVAQQ